MRMWRSKIPRRSSNEFAITLDGLLRNSFITPTPVLRYSEEPDRMSENPALRSTSEPAS